MGCDRGIFGNERCVWLIIILVILFFLGGGGFGFGD